MDLSTTYLGFKLPNPFIAGASPLADDLDTIKHLEDAGVSAIVLRSIFEEQIEHRVRHTLDEQFTWLYADATSYFPQSDAFVFDADEYLNHIQRIKRSTAVPIIASLNGTAPGDWLRFAAQIQEAGADALEMNLYYIAANPDEKAVEVEQRILDCLRSVKSLVSIPVSVKLSPYYSALANLVRQIDGLGAEGLVLFNRVYQSEMDSTMKDVPGALFSNSSELALRLRWLGILHGHFRGSLAVSGGVHSAFDAAKSIMAGADVIQLVSALLQHGPEFLREIRREFAAWMESNGYHSVSQMHGRMSLQNCPEPAAYERSNYARALQSWRC